MSQTLMTVSASDPADLFIANDIHCDEDGECFFTDRKEKSGVKHISVSPALMVLSEGRGIRRFGTA